MSVCTAHLYWRQWRARLGSWRKITCHVPLTGSNAYQGMSVSGAMAVERYCRAVSNRYTSKMTLSTVGTYATSTI